MDEIKESEKKKDIEVELKFQPTKEQLELMLDGAEKLPNEKMRDIYFDFEDFRLLKEDTRLRFRSSKKEGEELKGFFELKIRIDNKADVEIEDLKEIKEYLGSVSKEVKIYFDSGRDLDELMKDKKMLTYIDFKTDRKEYKKDGFKIDVDEIDFGEGEEKYKICEIEVMVSDEKLVKETKENIKKFANKYNFDTEKKVIPKGWEYLRRFNSKLYEEIYLARKNKEIGKDLNNEIRLK